MNAYRTNSAEAPAAGSPASEIVAGGRLIRKGATGHGCRVPGWFSRWRHGVRLGDKWECACGAVWVWTRWEHAPDAGHEVGLCNDCWVSEGRCRR